MASAQILNCIVCDKPIRPKQQAIQCDGCFRWNHRIYKTEVYRAAVRDGKEIDGQCAMCSHPGSCADPSSYLELGASELTFVDPGEYQPDAYSIPIENPTEFQRDVDNHYSTNHEESSLHDFTCVTNRLRLVSKGLVSKRLAPRRLSIETTVNHFPLLGIDNQR
ncbi:hypothetical protein AWC38_SpisGene5602 [Stylophora pistillata]|uniref:Uncharacterized protein n=1 Tax=Stylophora pistillata TaxID=50429 RepID=A0A2B4SJT5_STYPI|nr:hypothetical protein AWC38_SpisGene5602 [Stylophora pistillata]